MTAIWHQSEGKWGLLEPVGFPDEAALHDLVESNPEMLPLSGSPKLAVLGREVRLGSGYADSIAVEPSGRLAVIEIKLKNNPEARRAVVAQVLAYAARLYRLSYRALEDDVLRPHLTKLGARHIGDALAEKTQEFLESDEVERRVSDFLSNGAFRLVLVLDEVPNDLVAVVGYLEAVGQGVIVDLITVSAYQVGSDRIMVPQRIEPERVESPATPPVKSSQEPIPTLGANAFIAAIPESPPSAHERLVRLASWAQSVVDAGHASLRSVEGTTRRTLQVRIRGGDVGLATIATDNGGSLWLWQSVFAKRAPKAELNLANLSGGLFPKTIAGDAVSEDVLSLLSAAYAEAKLG